MAAPMAKVEGGRRIPKLVDAHKAGTSESEKCTLIIAEGDSAKEYALSVGFKILDREYYGIFPVRGKLVNVMDAPATRENPQIQKIQQILGLEDDKVYQSLAGLRYGKLLIMADQDHDGAHITGLLINVFYCYWPSLLKLNFLQRFVTPIVTASSKEKHEMFFTMADYMTWQNEVGDKAQGYDIKYFKGISTLGPTGVGFFHNMDKHVKNFVWFNERDDEAIEVAFGKNNDKKTERRDWLLQPPEGWFIIF